MTSIKKGYKGKIITYFEQKICTMDSISTKHTRKIRSIDINTVEYVDLTQECKENSLKSSCSSESKEKFQTSIHQFYVSVSASTRTKMQSFQPELLTKNLDVIDLCDDSEIEVDQINARKRNANSSFTLRRKKLRHSRKSAITELKKHNKNSLETDSEIKTEFCVNILPHCTRNLSYSVREEPKTTMSSLTKKQTKRKVRESLKERRCTHFEHANFKEESFASKATKHEDEKNEIYHSEECTESSETPMDTPPKNDVKPELKSSDTMGSEKRLYKSKKQIKSNLKTTPKSAEKILTFPRKRPGTIESEKNECPSYKRIEDTPFAVDGFNYGQIEGVTSYFLTHFHADHYTGLTKKFSSPIYASEITVNLIKVFKSVDENLLHVLPIDVTLPIEGILVTALEANHCPGAIMLLFELPCGKHILHTGDFRASLEMETYSHLKGRNIDLLYLDTTNIHEKKNIRSQDECISSAIQIIGEFKERNSDKRILFVICTDLIGKEKFWLSIAKAFSFKIWTEGKRKKVLRIIGNDEILTKLVEEPNEADMHIVSQVKAGYKHIDEYWNNFRSSYDMVFSIITKGPCSRSLENYEEVNLVTIGYSEHSSHKELRQFLKYLRPNRVISTVPLSRSLTRCAKIPVSWHCKRIFTPYKKQVSLTRYFDIK